MRLITLVAFVASTLAAAEPLGKRLDALFESAPNGFAGIEVVSMNSGRLLYERHSSRPFVPASNTKLFSTALALLKLGPEFRYETRVVLEPSGDLVLAGSGDPSFSGRIVPYSKDAEPAPPLAPIEDLADQIVAAGVTRINGDVIGDDTRYPWAPYPPSWTQDDAIREYGAPVSALTFNDNTVTITLRPGARTGDLARIELSPAVEYYALDNRVVTVSSSGEGRVRVSRGPGSRQIMLWGSIPLGRSGAVTQVLAIDDPALFAAQALADALTRRGVVISGEPKARHRSVAGDAIPVEGRTVAVRRSAPLVELLKIIDKVSQNLHAELILREVGLAARRMGTREAGLDELEAFLTEIGVGKDDFRFEDGSGLARNTLVTPRAIVRLLAHLYGTPHRQAWIDLLPIAGEDGTLSRRFQGAPEAKLIQAKTGSLSRALALSGYAESRVHGAVAFSILVNNYTDSQADVRRWIDRIGLALLE